MVVGMRVGVVSDTHGLVRPAVIERLQGCQAILHAGDIGKAQVLQDLAAVAPVHAIRGNVDRGPWAAEIPEQLTVTLGGRTIHLVHNIADLTLPGPVDVVVFGHSHKPLVDWRDDALYLNPGSIGPRRFKLPIAMALLHLEDAVRVEPITLPP